MTRCFCLPVLICALVGTFVLGGDARDDTKRMQGTWKPVRAELGGKAFPDKILKTMTLVLTDGKYTVTAGEQSDEGTVKLQPAKRPPAMDITGTKGPNRDKTIPAIYELKGDTLRICYDLSSKARPTEFKTKENTQQFLVEYQRQKP